MKTFIPFILIFVYNINLYFNLTFAQEKTSLKKESARAIILNQRAYPDKIKSDVNLLYPNINISNDSLPQNEPSIKFNHQYPGYVLAAWRDFRTGYDPLIRRIGYSYSSDAGQSWSESGLIPQLDSIHVLSSDPAVTSDIYGNFYVATISTRSDFQDLSLLVYKSADQGRTFTSGINIAPHIPYIENDDKEYITCDLSLTSPFKNTLYVIWKRYYSSSISSLITKSTNSGINWTDPIEILSPPATLFFATIPVTDSDGNLFVIGTGRGASGVAGIYVCKSSDHGNSFSSYPIEHFDGVLGYPSIDIDLTEGLHKNFIYASWPEIINGFSKIYFSASTNGGSSWSKSIPVNTVNDSISQTFPWLSVSSTGNIFLVYHQSSGSSVDYYKAMIAKSTDRGESFINEELSLSYSLVGNGTPAGHYIGMDSKSGKVIPVWVDQREGGINSEIYSSVINDNSVIIEPISNNVPDNISLSQNYPNPFNPATKINFSIPITQYTILRVYDVLGKEVTILVNEKLSAGTYEVEFVGTNLPGGVYFYRLESANFIETKSMILLK